MAYAILRTEKLKSYGKIGEVQAHLHREIDTPNAGPGRVVQLAGSGDQLSARVRERIEHQTGKPARANAVVGVQVLLTASPDYFEDGDGTLDMHAVREWARAAKQYIAKEWGRDNVMDMTLHMDERTPHIHAVVTPITPDGRLSARDWLGGRQKLSAMQDRYHEAVAHLGLERGLKGSKAEHESIQEYYKRVNQPFPEPSKVKFKPADPPKPSWRDFFEPEAYAHRHAEAERKRRGRELGEVRREEIKTATAQAREANAKADRLEKERVKIRREADRVRDIPLDRVMEAMQCQPDKNDKAKWHTPAGPISINDAKWYNHIEQKGGGGAIDLVMHVRDTDFQDAVRFLGGSIDSDAAAAAAANRAYHHAKATASEPAAPTKAPAPSTAPEHRQKVRHYLTQERGLAPETVDAALDKGVIYPTQHKSGCVNVVFRHGPDSAEIRGTEGKFKQFLGPRRANEPFVLPPMDGGAPDHHAVVESGIDALSYQQRHPRALVLSWAGTQWQSAKEWVQKWADKARVVIAYDADKAGDNAFSKLQKETGASLERARPDRGKDWNDHLIQTQKDEAKAQREAEKAEAKRQAEAKAEAVADAPVPVEDDEDAPPAPS